MTERQERHLMNEVKYDDIYQDLLKLRNMYERDFDRILLTLSPQDQHCLKMYVKACVAAESRISRTAYFLTPKI